MWRPVEEEQGAEEPLVPTATLTAETVTESFFDEGESSISLDSSGSTPEECGESAPPPLRLLEEEQQAPVAQASGQQDNATPQHMMGPPAAVPHAESVFTSKAAGMSKAFLVEQLEQENARLRKAVSDLTLDKMILAEAAKGNY